MLKDPFDLGKILGSNSVTLYKTYSTTKTKSPAIRTTRRYKEPKNTYTIGLKIRVSAVRFRLCPPRKAPLRACLRRGLLYDHFRLGRFWEAAPCNRAAKSSMDSRRSSISGFT